MQYSGPMPDLIPCAGCCEFFRASEPRCPWCDRERSNRSVIAPEHVLLVGLGLVFGSGCGRAVAIYGAACTDSACGACGDSLVEVFGEVSGSIGSPLGTPVDAGEPLELAQALWRCGGDSDPDPERGLYEGLPRMNIQVAGITVQGEFTTVEVIDGVPDRFAITDVSGGMTVDGAAAPNLQVRLEVEDDSGALLDGDQIPSPLPVSGGVWSLNITDGMGTLEVAVSTVTE